MDAAQQATAGVREQTNRLAGQAKQQARSLLETRRTWR
jgi:hypothetical protein